MKGKYNAAGSKLFIKIDPELFSSENEKAKTFNYMFTHIDKKSTYDFGFWKMYQSKLPSRSLHVIVTKDDFHKMPFEGTVTKIDKSRIKVSTDKIFFGISQNDVYNELCCFGHYMDETGEGMTWDAFKKCEIEKWYRN